MTRLPSPLKLQWSESELAQSTPWFVMVGSVVGCLAALAWWLGYQGWSASVGALFALTVSILATGAFHEDGLADSADGLGGAFEVEKKLAIMRDSRIGTYGSVALVLTVFLKVHALATIPTHLVPWVIISAHSVARWTALPLIIFNPYVREEGTGKPFAATVSKQSLVIGSAMTIMITAACVGFDAILVIAIVIIFVLIAQHFLRKQLGGVTGDTLGAVNSCTELLIYMIFAVQL